MGLLKHLLFWPVTGPSFLVRFSLRRVDGVVRDELTDEGRVKEELLELQLRLELGDIDDETYAAEEAALMARLREVQTWRERYGMATRGPVRMAAPEPEPPEEEEAATSTSDATVDLHLGFEDEEDRQGG